MILLSRIWECRASCLSSSKRDRGGRYNHKSRRLGSQCIMPLLSVATECNRNSVQSQQCEGGIRGLAFTRKGGIRGLAFTPPECNRNSVQFEIFAPPGDKPGGGKIHSLGIPMPGFTPRRGLSPSCEDRNSRTRRTLTAMNSVFNYLKQQR